jgi:hypothetical protein
VKRGGVWLAECIGKPVVVAINCFEQSEAAAREWHKVKLAPEKTDSRNQVSVEGFDWNRD